MKYLGSLVSKKCSIYVVISLIAIYSLHLLDLDDKILLYGREITTSQQVKDSSIWLPNYQIDKTSVIPGIAGNASGITYDQDRETLWIVVNNPTYLVEIDLDFEFQRRINLINFKDTESIAYAQNGLFLITDEYDESISLAVITPQTKQLDKKRLPQVTLNFHGQGNKGLEGIASDPATSSIYTVRERDPMQLFKVTGLIQDSRQLSISNQGKIDVNSLYLDDLSGLHFDSKTNHLLFLSDESKLLAEVDLTGNKISFLDLKKGFNGLTFSIPQPEGVTMDHKSLLYIVSEPNLIFRYHRSP